MYVERNSVAVSWNHCGSGRAISIACSECVFVALGIQHAGAHAPYCHLWPGCAVFSHFISTNGYDFRKRESY